MDEMGGTIIFFLIIGFFIIRSAVKISKISEAEEIKRSYPEGFRQEIRWTGSINYDKAKRIVDRRSSIVSAQCKYDEQKRIKEERMKAAELKRLYPHAVVGRSDDYIVRNEASIRAAENQYTQKKESALSILRDFPEGVSKVCGHISSYSITDSQIESIILNSNQIRIEQNTFNRNKEEVERLKPQLDDLRKKYPNAIRAICKERSWSLSSADDIRTLLLMTGTLSEGEQQEVSRILSDKVAFNEIYQTCQRRIKARGSAAKVLIKNQYGKLSEHIFAKMDSEEAFERYSKHLDDVVNKQTDFARETRSLFSNTLESWCYYDYSFDFVYEDGQEHAKQVTLPVWQAFSESCCFDDTISYEYYPFFKENRIFRQQLETTYHYNPPKFDKIFSFISTLQERYGEKVCIVLANTDNLSSDAYDNNYKYFQGELESRGITYYNEVPVKTISDGDQVFVIVDVITENANLKRFCTELFKRRYYDSSKPNKHLTRIVFVTLLKCFDGAEVEALNEKKRKGKEAEIRKAREEEERKRREEEQLKKDAEDISKAKTIASSYAEGYKYYFPEVSVYGMSANQARQIIQKESYIRNHCETLSRVIRNVSDWNNVAGIPHYFFYHYYPTRFTDISSVSREARTLVYNFKDGMDHSRVKDLVVTKLRDTFSSSDLSKMTFVCIPASTIVVNRNRYESFSSEVCSSLGMKNGFNYITITREKTPSHLGGTDSAGYSYDRSFFRGEIVVLFDDIVTRGGSLSSMKRNLESLGATVICAISIGRTFSDYYGDNRKPHPYTGTM